MNPLKILLSILSIPLVVMLIGVGIFGHTSLIVPMIVLIGVILVIVIVVLIVKEII